MLLVKTRPHCLSLDGGVDDPHTRRPDVGPRAVALDEGDEGVIGHVEPAILELDPMPRGRGFTPSRARHLLLRGPFGPLRFRQRALACECQCCLILFSGGFLKESEAKVTMARGGCQG